MQADVKRCSLALVIGSKSFSRCHKDEQKFRAVIKHFYLKTSTAAQIKTELDEVYGDPAPASKTVCDWINAFQRGGTSAEYEACFGCPFEITTGGMMGESHCIIMKHRRVKEH